MARHALGLTEGRRKSYRNRYVAGIGTDAEERWDDLVRRGLAQRDGGCFRLTEEGARAALNNGEKLDPEDFPEEPNAED
jgi:carotenoid cleavage dioxygenase-like enzyme